MQQVLLEQRGNAAKLVINRPPHNILNLEAIREMLRMLNSIKSKPDICLLEIIGAGEKAFSTGVDIQEHLPDKIHETLQAFHKLILHIRSLPFPSIALVRGLCLGGGCELALSCDLVLAEENAKFGFPEISIGCFPPAACAILPELVGRKKAFEMVFLGEQFSAKEALELGLVNKVVEAGGVEKTAEAWESLIQDKSRVAICYAKEALDHSAEPPFVNRLENAEKVYLEKLIKTRDAVEGVKAFLEKRKPVWKGD